MRQGKASKENLQTSWFNFFTKVYLFMSQTASWSVDYFSKTSQVAEAISELVVIIKTSILICLPKTLGSNELILVFKDHVNLLTVSEIKGIERETYSSY